MFVSEVCHLTTKDFTILEIMREQPFGSDDLMRSIVSRKLSNTIVMLRDQIPATIVTLGSQVTYSINDGPSETRVVADDDFHGLFGLLPILPISHPRGLAMLGVAEGASVILRPHDGPTEKITVLDVMHQPEAARRLARGYRKMAEPFPAREPRVLRRHATVESVRLTADV